MGTYVGRNKALRSYGMPRDVTGISRIVIYPWRARRNGVPLRLVTAYKESLGEQVALLT
jgi:hypothetical protein